MEAVTGRETTILQGPTYRSAFNSAKAGSLRPEWRAETPARVSSEGNNRLENACSRPIWHCWMMLTNTSEVRPRFGYDRTGETTTAQSTMDTRRSLTYTDRDNVVARR